MSNDIESKEVECLRVENELLYKEVSELRKKLDGKDQPERPPASCFLGLLHDWSVWFDISWRPGIQERRCLTCGKVKIRPRY